MRTEVGKLDQMNQESKSRSMVVSKQEIKRNMIVGKIDRKRIILTVRGA